MWFVLALGCAVEERPPVPRGEAVVMVATRSRGSFASPWGELSGRNAEGLCKAPLVRVGTVTGVGTYEKVMHKRDGAVAGSMIFSTLTFETEATLRGPSTTTFRTDVHGGVLNGKRSGTTAMEPQPVVGARYLTAFVVHRDPEGIYDWPDGQLIHAAVVPLAAGASVVEAKMASELAALCASVRKEGR